MSIPNRFDIVLAVDMAHPHLVLRNTRETCTEFIWRAVWALSQTDANFGFLSKSAAENHVEIPGAGKVSIDAICYRGQQPVVDILSAAGDGPGTGGIGWREDEDRRPSNEWVQAVPYPDSPVPEPEPEPEPGGDEIAKLQAQILLLAGRLDDVEQQLIETAADAAQANARIDKLEAAGEVDLPIVIEWLARRGRAKGYIKLKVTE